MCAKFLDYVEINEVQPDHEDDIEGHAQVKDDIEKFAVRELVVPFVVHKFQSITRVKSRLAMSDSRIILQTGFSMRFCPI